MIDMHTHILPAVDDGAKDCDEAHEILRLLQADGVNQVVFTPHFYWQSQTVEKFLQKREKATNSIQCPIQSYLGAEVEFGELKIDYSALSPLYIQGTRYILLELPFTQKWSPRLFENLRAFMQETNSIPIIAHIERYPAVLRHPKHASELLSMGCLLQVNAQTLIQVRPHSFVDVLMRYGQIQVLGTDAHNTNLRKPQYARSISHIKTRYGEDCVDYMQKCMEKILNNEKIEVPYLHPIKKIWHRYR